MKDKRILILGIFILMALATTITYAYFSAKIIGSETESTLVFDAGTLGINLDGGNTLNGDKMIPGDTPFSTKKFTVIGNNNSNGYMPYSVNLVIDENTYSTNAISYTLELVTAETDNNGEPIENRKNTPINYTDIIGSGYFTKGSNIKHTYLLKMYFLDTHTDQSADMKARFNAHIEITGNRASKNKVTVTFDADGGEVETLSKEVVIGSAYGNLPIPTKEGYEFLGWNGGNLLNISNYSYDKSDESGIRLSLDNGLYKLNGTTNYYFAGEKAFDLYDLNNIANYPVYLNIRNTLLLTKGTYTLSIYKISGNIPSKLTRVGIITTDSEPANRNYISTIILSNQERYNTFTLLNDTEVYFYLSYLTNETSNTGNVIFDNLQFYVKLQKIDEYEPYFIDKYTKVVQYENHTLKAIWKEI